MNGRFHDARRHACWDRAFSLHRSSRSRFPSTCGMSPKVYRSGFIGCSLQTGCLSPISSPSQPPEPLATFLDLNGYLPAGIPC